MYVLQQVCFPFAEAIGHPRGDANGRRETTDGGGLGGDRCSHPRAIAFDLAAVPEASIAVTMYGFCFPST